MASIAIEDVHHGVTVGRVFGRGLDVIRANPVATLGLSFVFSAAPSLLLTAAGGQSLMLAGLRTGAYAIAGLYIGLFGLLWLIAAGGLVHATVVHRAGGRASPLEMVRVGILRCLPLLAVYLLLMIGVWLGSIFFIVPGIMLAVRWAVVLPVIVAEPAGVFGAFRRSATLTKGARWQVFGIGLLAVVVYMLTVSALGIVTVAGAGSFAALAGSATTQPLALRLVQSLVTTVMLTWLTTVGASLYVELRDWKDGPDADRLADIFA